MDKNLVEHAKTYIEKMANGINPLTNEAIPPEDLLNNVKISRCLFYVNTCLEELLKKNFKEEKENFYISEEELKKFVYSENAITISEIVKRINDLKAENRKKLQVKQLLSWLIEIGILQVEVEQDKNVKRPTQAGEELGIKKEHRIGLYNNYTVLLYNKKAQEFIIDNFSLFLQFLDKK